MKKILSTVLSAAMLMAMLAIPAFAAGIENGSEAYVTVDSMNVSNKPSFSKTVALISNGDKVTVLEAYIDGEDETIYHKVQLADGTVGYVWAYANRTDTLEPAEDTEKIYEETTAPSDSDKYQHGINMYFLKDYIYGGSKALDGERVQDYTYAKMPDEWTRHKRPDSLPLVGMAVLHIGDEGKEGMIRASFYPEGYPGNPTDNYHAKGLMNSMR